jgi:hypothetical protein
MRKVYKLIALTLIAAVLQASAAKFRTFSDSQGREIEAKLTRVSGDDIYIERHDGLNTKVDISIFSAEDQSYIRDWERKEIIKDDTIAIRFKTDVENKSGWESYGVGIERKTWKESYAVVLTNESQLDLKDLRIEYLILKYEDALAAQKRVEGDVRQLTGVTKVPLLKARGEVIADTKKFPMLETRLAQGYIWKGGGKKTSEDDMRGIWVKVYVGDILAAEVSKPENLMRKEKWPTSAAF